VVVATAPWFLLPGSQAGRFVVLLRLARIARLVVASPGSRRLFERLGRVAVVALGVVFIGSLVAYYAERHVNSEFATFGDSIWWGIVTLTTVGYGDIVPETATGRWAGVTIMVTGIAVLGLLSGSLASFFRLDGGDTDDEAGKADAVQPSPTSNDAALEALTSEMSALRRQVETLTQYLIGRQSGQDSGETANDQ
jgi:voltage-gated potassium channel